jgi:hypothetical protein
MSTEAHGGPFIRNSTLSEKIRFAISIMEAANLTPLQAIELSWHPRLGCFYAY